MYTCPRHTGAKHQRPNINRKRIQNQKEFSTNIKRYVFLILYTESFSKIKNNIFLSFLTHRERKRGRGRNILFKFENNCFGPE